MAINRYEDLSANELDVFREIGSIGNGNAATALSGILMEKVNMEMPEVGILEFNEAQKRLGEPEEIVAAVLVELSGKISGIMMLILKKDFVRQLTGKVLGRTELDMLRLDSMEESLLLEAGNIMISSYVNALSSLARIPVELSVPQIAVNMLGGVISMPLAMMGIVSDKLMMIKGKFFIGEAELSSDMLLLPDIDSLNNLMEGLGVR